MVGATAIIHRIPLFTYNLKDFKFMPGIKLHEVSNQANFGD
jgi:hypothetical protein